MTDIKSDEEEIVMEEFKIFDFGILLFKTNLKYLILMIKISDWELVM